MTNVTCPDCKTKFPGPDALQRHIEQGDCPALTPEGFTWEAPPTGGRHGEMPSEGALIMLRTKPGKWARIKTCEKQSTASQLAKRWNKIEKEKPEGEEYEFKGGRFMGGSAVWARFIDY